MRFTSSARLVMVSLAHSRLRKRAWLWMNVMCALAAVEISWVLSGKDTCSASTSFSRMVSQATTRPAHSEKAPSTVEWLL